MNIFKTKNDIRIQMNKLGAEREPFLFMVDFEGKEGAVIPLTELPGTPLSCSINGKEIGNTHIHSQKAGAELYKEKLLSSPISKQEYAKGFDKIAGHIKHGDSYLLNYTCSTYIGDNLDMAKIYTASRAPYKLLWKGHLVFFSPEPFIKISGNKISSFPMKGTINARIPEAEQLLLNNKKELYEHYTIVDLIRNDLSIISRNVKVEKFRYVEKIETSSGPLLQTSSAISGNLPENWRGNLGTLLFKLLPAGSISGAPKEKTVEIIKKCEISPRGYYTGIMGVFDGTGVESCVIIRFIEKRDDGYYYRSGGGITALSDMEEEYEELIAKIYVPSV